MVIIEKYICVKDFVIELYDEDEIHVENEHFIIEKGSVWEKQEFSYMSDIRLINDKGRWLEISKEDLISDFKESKK